ncbi:MAG: glycosyltransferase family 39 protein [Rhodospirillaceae bacterium]|nr:glycosyltransferase family 39 protein [Rhodospirillaceae bacterium]
MPAVDPSAPVATPPDTASLRVGWLGLGPQTLLFALYCAAFYALRVALSHGLEQDGAARHFEAQVLALAYTGNDPPLYTWVLIAVARLVGPGPQATLAINYLLLTGAFAALLASARMVLGEARWAALAAWSLVAFPPVVLGHFALDHSIQVVCAAALTLLAALSLVRHGRPRDYLALGAALGFGMMAKYNFPLLVAALVLAALAQAPVRRRLASPWLLATVAMALAVASPILAVHLRTLGQWYSTVSQLRDGGLGPLDARLSGVAGVVTSSLAFAWPLLLVLAVAAPRAFDPRKGGRPAGIDPVLARLVRDMLLAGLAVMLAWVLAAGLPSFNERYMLPLLFALPIHAAVRVLAVGSPAGAVPRFAAGLGAVTAVVLALRLLELTPFCPQRCAELVPYDRLADALREAGFGGGTIVTGAGTTAGNLAVHFPGSRVLVARRPELPPRAPAGQCLGIWDMSDWGPEIARARVLDALGLAPDEADAITEEAVVPWHGGTFSWSWPPQWQERTTEWRYVLLEDAVRCP